MAYSYKTSLVFGFVYIPVELHTIIKNNDIGFNMLHKKTMERIQYKKTCPDCESDVEQEDIIKGFEYDRDQYVTFSNDEFNKLKTKKDKSIVVEQFSDLSDIDPIYYDRSFYIVPTNAFDAYRLMAEVMQKQEKVAIAKTVLGTKEVVVSIRSKNGVLILSTMYFEEEVQAQPYHADKVKINEKELTVAKSLLNAMEKKFDAKDFVDEYKLRLEKAIDQKIKGRHITKAKDIQVPSRVTNLMAALKKSLSIKERNALKKSNVFVMPKKRAKTKMKAKAKR